MTDALGRVAAAATTVVVTPAGVPGEPVADAGGPYEYTLPPGQDLVFTADGSRSVCVGGCR